jgi:hypothetical protein
MKVIYLIACIICAGGGVLRFINELISNDSVTSKAYWYAIELFALALIFTLGF